MTQLSLLLTGFIRTLNFVNTVEIDDLNTLAFENFSNALLSNDFTKLEASYKNLSASIKNAKENKKFKHLSSLLQDIETILNDFEDFGSKKLHEKYLILSRLMHSKHYYLLSLTYLFEAIRLYCSYSFYKKRIISKHAWENFDKYKLNSDVMSCISQKEIGDKYRPTYYDKNNFYSKNNTIFHQVAIEYNKFRILRNNLTHINHDKSQPNIKKDLGDLIEKISSFIEDDIFRNLKK